MSARTGITHIPVWEEMRTMVEKFDSLCQTTDFCDRYIKMEGSNRVLTVKTCDEYHCKCMDFIYKNISPSRHYITIDLVKDHCDDAISVKELKRLILENEGKSHQKYDDVRMAMHKLWYDHVARTRMYIISAMSNLPDANAALEILMQNQVDIGTAWGKLRNNVKKGEELTQLLKTHIAQAGEIVADVMKGDMDGVKRVSKKWFDNAMEISVLLSQTSKGNVNDIYSHMKMHLDSTTNEVLARHKALTSAGIAAAGNPLTAVNKVNKIEVDRLFKLDVDAYLEVVKTILEMSDVLTQLALS